MSKERLEEIKQTINHPNYTEHNGQEEIYFMVSDNDFNWLINRVEELEENLNDYQAINKELHQRIRKHRKEKRKYKQALEEIDTFMEHLQHYAFEGDDHLWQTRKMIEKALEQENE